jgi:asparagine synthase (glutamine-hydrolysing)
MCGVVGMVGVGADEGIVRRMSAMVRHRGPDEDGCWSAEGVSLGHQRLRVIDLATGRQPIANEDGSIRIIYNGEVYNFRALRRELESKGHRFATASDTEVIVHLYEEEGPMGFARLDGIFAFAIWDAPRRSLVLARDPFGVKPLHYHFDGATLRFGSEIKALLSDPAVPRRLNPQSAHDFLNIRFVPGEATLFADIHRLPPGHYLVWRDGTIALTRYWQLGQTEDDRPSADRWAEGIRERLAHAVERQLVSDVPLGLYLSGGLDSSALVAAAKPHLNGSLRTFTLGFNEPTDELDDARLVAEHFHTEHHATTLDANPLAHLPAVVWHAEEPKVNVLQGYLLARFARAHVTVALGGLGGDELFGGYDIYRYLAPLAGLHRWMPSPIANGPLEWISRLAFAAQDRPSTWRWHEHRLGVQWLASVGRRERMYALLRNAWDFNPGLADRLYGPAMRETPFRLVEDFFTPYFSNDGTSMLTQTLRAELEQKMVNDFLLNEDRVSMAHGLEVRVPFLDRELVSYAASIPAALKLAHGETKHLFKRAVAPWLPDAVLRKKKWGFTFSSYHQFTKDLRGVAERILTPGRVAEVGWFNYAWIRDVLRHPPHPRLRWHYFVLWMMVGFEIWRQMFLAGTHVEGPRPLEEYYG